MSTTAATTKEFMQDYLDALSGKPKDEQLIEKYVADPNLRQHILDTEAAFPGYRLEVQQMVAEGNMAAINVTFRAVHEGPFAGIAPTGKVVSASAMMFYRVDDGKIQKFWMQIDMSAVMAQLQG